MKSQFCLFSPFLFLAMMKKMRNDRITWVQQSNNNCIIWSSVMKWFCGFSLFELLQKKKKRKRKRSFNRKSTLIYFRSFQILLSNRIHSNILFPLGNGNIISMLWKGVSFVYINIASFVSISIPLNINCHQ